MDQPAIYMDPNIDMTSNAVTGIIIQFRTKPIHTYPVHERESQVSAVENSHGIFLKTIHRQLDSNDIPYHIQHVYKNTFNGVSMKIRADHIHHILICEEIGAIYLNREMKIPTKPNDPRYQL